MIEHPFGTARSILDVRPKSANDSLKQRLPKSSPETCMRGHYL